MVTHLLGKSLGCWALILVMLMPMPMLISAGPSLAQAAEPSQSALPKPPDRRSYLNTWQTMPTLVARTVPQLKKVTVQPVKGRVEVLVFLASWNVTTLRIIRSLQQLERDYSSRKVDFVYAFSHDQLVDIRGFLKEFPLTGQAILANRKVLAAHANPKIPTLLISDKHNWLTLRTSSFTDATFTRVDALLAALTGW